MWGQVIFSRGEPRLRWLSGCASRLLPLPHGPRHAREEKAGPQGRSPKLPLNFHATRPDTSGLKEQSPNGSVRHAGRGGEKRPGERVAGSSHLGRLVRRAGLLALPSRRRTRYTPASAAPSFLRTPPFKREAQLDLCRPSEARLPLWRSVAAALTAAVAGRAEQKAGASGRRPPSPQRAGGARRAATGAEEGGAWPDWGRGGGERRGAGSPAPGSAP